MIYTNEELNRMAAGVLGECWHEPDEVYEKGDASSPCRHCGEWFELTKRDDTRPDYCNDRNHAVRVADAVDEGDLQSALCDLAPNYISLLLWAAKLPAKTLLLSAFVAHGIMPMDEAKENL